MSATDAAAIRTDMPALGRCGRTALPVAVNAYSLIGKNGLEEVHTAEAVGATRIAAPAPKMNTNIKVVDQKRQAKKQKMPLGKRKHAVVHKPTVVE